MWYTGSVLSTAGLGGSTTGSRAQGKCRFNIYCPGLEGSSAGSRVQGHPSHTVLYGLVYGHHGASLVNSHAGLFVCIFS